MFRKRLNLQYTTLVQLRVSKYKRKSWRWYFRLKSSIISCTEDTSSLSLTTRRSLKYSDQQEAVAANRLARCLASTITRWNTEEERGGVSVVCCIKNVSQQLNPLKANLVMTMESKKDPVMSSHALRQGRLVKCLRWRVTQVLEIGRLLNNRDRLPLSRGVRLIITTKLNILFLTLCI